MRLQCQQTYLHNQRCQKTTYGDEEVCRWHKILREFRADMQRRGGWAGSAVIYGAAASFFIGGVALWYFIQTPDAIIWLLIAFYGLGYACVLFATGIIARDYPLSQFAFWLQLWATGIVIHIVGSLVGALYLLINPQAGLPAVRAVFGNDPQWLIYGPPLLVLICTVSSALNLRLLLNRVLFYRNAQINWILWFGVLGLAGTAFVQVLRKYNPINPDNHNGFWEAVLGNNVGLALTIAYIGGFFLCQIINARIRRRNLDEDGFRRTFRPSFSACVSLPVLSLVASRYLLFWLGVSGVVPFVITALIINIPLCIRGTRLVIHWAT